MATYVFTVLGPDEPGLVDRIAALVVEHGGNWERSHMARLGGRFAGIVEVGLPDERSDALKAALSSLRGLEVIVDESGVEPAAPGTTVTLSLVGSDRPGLVHSVTQALVEVGANIEELTSTTSSAPMAGGSLFEATVTVALPASLDVAIVRERLEALADRLMVDLDLTT